MNILFLTRAGHRGPALLRKVRAGGLLGLACLAAGAHARSPVHLRLRWIVDGQVWRDEVEAFTPGENGAMAAKLQGEAPRAAFDLPYEPAVELRERDKQVWLKASLTQPLDHETSRTVTWEGTLRRAETNPIQLGQIGRDIRLEVTAL